MATLDDVPFFQRPIGNMQQIGTDELGNPVYVNALTGAQYMLNYGQRQPQRDYGATPYGRPDDRRVSNWTPNASGAANALRSAPNALVGAAVNALATPGRAAMGQPVTYGDVYDTAGFAQLGGAAQTAPANALRSGAMRTTTPAQEVAEMLRTGRAADVTDELMAQVDPQEMWRLYESGATGIDMPMDAASRAERAQGMYRDAVDAADFEYVGLRTVEDPEFLASESVRWDDGARLGSEPMGGTSATDARAKGAFAFHPNTGTPYSARNGYYPGEFTGVLGAHGSQAGEDIGEMVMRNPQLLFARNAFARFDPRLSHLSTLNAANASPIVGAGSMATDNGGLTEMEREELLNYIMAGYR